MLELIFKNLCLNFYWCTLMLDFSDEALQVVPNDIKEFRRALGKLQLEPEPLYAQILLFEFEDLIKFRCLKYSSKRGAKKIEAFDVNNVLKKLSARCGDTS